jgi:catechol 2,3-dioxygenase-like lactoylglutathione lyase family enzyme
MASGRGRSPTVHLPDATTAGAHETRRGSANATREPEVDFKLEVVGVPVSDVAEAKAFYEHIGFHIDYDLRLSSELRFVQITPPGSFCSIVIGDGVTSAPPGSAQRLLLVVDDLATAQAQLRAAGVEVREIQDSPTGQLAFFSDPDGNGWVVQQLAPQPVATPRF